MLFFSDDEYTGGQTWLELLVGLPNESNENIVRIKEEPPDNESSNLTSFNVVLRADNGSRKSSLSDQGNGVQDSDNVDDRLSDTAQNLPDQVRTGDSVSILRNTAQSNSGFGKQVERNLKEPFEFSWHKVGGNIDIRPTYPSAIANSQSSSISRPITLMDLKSSANIPTISSLAPKSYQSSGGQANSFSDLQCHVCNKIFKDNKTYRRHMSAHRQPSDYPCNQCGRTFSLKMQLRRHNCAANMRHMQRSPTMSPTHPYSTPPARPPFLASKFKPIPDGPQMQPAASSILKMVACEECGRRFSRQQDLSRHVCAKPVTDALNQTAMASAPNAEVMTLLTLAQLNKNRVSADYPITCSGCGWSFSRRQDLRRHKCSGDIRKLLNNREGSSRKASSESPRPMDTASAGQETESLQYRDDDSLSQSPKPKTRKYEYMCAKCGSNYYTEDELQSHIDKCILEDNGPQNHKPNSETADTDQKNADESAENVTVATVDEDESSSTVVLNYQGSGTNPTSNTGLWRLVITNTDQYFRYYIPPPLSKRIVSCILAIYFNYEVTFQPKTLISN